LNEFIFGWTDTFSRVTQSNLKDRRGDRLSFRFKDINDKNVYSCCRSWSWRRLTFFTRVVNASDLGIWFLSLSQRHRIRN
jgi:hypothetical protein